MDLQIIKLDGQSGGTIAVTDKVFDSKFNESLIHQVLTAHGARARAGTRSQKTRSEVSGGGTKPWRQKGTGRARAGTIRSPIWRGGGVTFAAKPKNYRQKVNKKMYRAAMRSILSELVRQNRLLIVDELIVSEPKTKLIVSILRTLNINKSVLLITDQINQNLFLAARNLPGVEICNMHSINPDNLIRFDVVVMPQAVISYVGAWLG
jgi:large subunit ribosomal protein L4